MSHSLSPSNRNSIFGWVKNLKRGNLVSNDSINDVTSDNELMSTESRSPSKSISIPHNSLHPQHSHNHGQYGQSPGAQPLQIQPSYSQTSQDLLRPFLNHKSRSSNNVNRVRSNSLSQSETSILRQHRDSFLQHNPLVEGNSIYFGVPLEDALREASAKISILKTNPADPGLTYGEIPIVVAKCGVFLKNNGLNVEGIFRVGGSSKRLKELQVIFNTPPDFGKKLNWDGYNVHDAASILRRYLNALPQPLIPLDLYESFRDPLRSKTKIVSYMKYKAENPNASLRSKKSPTPTSVPANITPETPVDLLDSTDSQPLTEANIGILNSASSNSPSYEQKEQDTRGRKEPRVPHSASVSQSDLSVLKPQTKVSKQQADEAAAKKSAKKSKNYKKLTHDVHEAIDEYKQLVNELPTVSKQLLFYILDLLAMVQNHSDENLMSSRNLAAIFQPSILSHPNHDMDPVEYALSQHVVEFLIQYAYKLLPKQINPLEGSKEISDIENDLTSLQLDGVGVPPVCSPAIETTGLPSNTSNVTSTSTTPIDAAPGTLLSKPPRAPFKRQYSNSLPSSNQDDLVGYRNKSKQIPMLDSDNEFEITDEDDNDIDISDLDEMNDNLQLNRSNGGEDFVPTEEIKNFEEPNEIINPDEQPKTIETKPCHQPRPSANVAIIVSTPSSSAVPRVS